MAKTEQKMERPLWLKIKSEEVEDLVVKLSKEGNTSEKIGLILRDQYGIPTTKLYGKRISQILMEKGITQSADLVNIEKKFERIKKHLEKHHTDRKSKRALSIRTARVRKVKAYVARKSKK